MKSIAIIGYGFVGKAVADLFVGKYELVVYDPKEGHTPLLDTVNDCDLSIVCVPTPKSLSGAVDLTILDEVIGWLDTPVIVVKSTVPPGTCRRLMKKTGKRIVFSPEFGGESAYVIPWWKGMAHPTDIKYQSFQIFGGDKPDTRYVAQFFKSVLGPTIKYMQTDHNTAELSKYMSNIWGAMKVTFANEFFEIANVFDVDYDEARELALLAGFMESMHTAVFEDKRGFGGKCFPKDIHGLVAASEANGYSPALLKQVIASNDAFVAKNKETNT